MLGGGGRFGDPDHTRAYTAYIDAGADLNGPDCVRSPKRRATEHPPRRVCASWRPELLGNSTPQGRHVLCADEEEVHAAAWPRSAAQTQGITRFIALEGGFSS